MLLFELSPDIQVVVSYAPLGQILRHRGVFEISTLGDE